MDKIALKGISARGFHGVFPEERRLGQRFVVDVEVGVRALSATDALDDTVNYAAVADLVVAAVEGEPVQLIETLAAAIVEGILESQPLAELVTVTVHKPEAPIAHHFDDVAVTITRSR